MEGWSVRLTWPLVSTKDSLPRRDAQFVVTHGAQMLRLDIHQWVNFRPILPFFPLAVAPDKSIATLTDIPELFKVATPASEDDSSGAAADRCLPEMQQSASISTFHSS